MLCLREVMVHLALVVVQRGLTLPRPLRPLRKGLEDEILDLLREVLLAAPGQRRPSLLLPRLPPISECCPACPEMR